MIHQINTEHAAVKVWPDGDGLVNIRISAPGWCVGPMSFTPAEAGLFSQALEMAGIEIDHRDDVIVEAAELQHAAELMLP